MELDNLIIGQNIARLRKLKDIKAFDMAERIGMKEAVYTKYERGETAINVDFIQKVSEELGVDPFAVLTATPSNIIENLTNASVVVNNSNSTIHTTNEQQTLMMIKLMESIVSMNERILGLLEREKR